MRIAVLGTGYVGRSIAGRLDELGHHVEVGTRSPDRTLARVADGEPSFADWQQAHPSVGLRPFASAAAYVPGTPRRRARS